MTLSVAIPFSAAWCILARLGAVYERQIDGHSLTLAVSSYTYGDGLTWRGGHAFVLWDRDSQSLWWPHLARPSPGC